MRRSAHSQAQTAPSRDPRRSAPHKVRIIGGKWKRTLLPVPDVQGLRPTPDRVRETVFNWLNHAFDGRWETLSCLDLFAGSGALGFEAASRGAARVVMAETSGAVVRQLEETVARLGAGQQIQVHRTDALALMRTMTTERFDIIFLDPPFHEGWMGKILPLCEDLLTSRGLVYAEAEQPLSPEHGLAWLEGWEVIRADKAGMVFYHLLQRKSKADFQA